MTKILNRRVDSTCWLIACAVAGGVFATGMQAATVDAAGPPATTPYSAADIATRNIQARGGAKAWHAVRTLSYSGTLQAGIFRPDEKLRIMDPQLAKIQEANEPKEALQPRPIILPIRVERERPLKQRIEIDMEGKTAVQVYDGKRGFKVRPFLGRHEVEPFTPAQQELVEKQPPDFEPLLLNYAADGDKIESDGIESIDGQPAYKLKLTLKSGVVDHVWVDTHTLLEVQTAAPRRINGRERQVLTQLKEYRAAGEVQWPYLQETRVLGARDAEVLHIEHLQINPVLSESRFAKPE